MLCWRIDIWNIPCISRFSSMKRPLHHGKYAARWIFSAPEALIRVHIRGLQRSTTISLFYSYWNSNTVLDWKSSYFILWAIYLVSLHPWSNTHLLNNPLHWGYFSVDCYFPTQVAERPPTRYVLFRHVLHPCRPNPPMLENMLHRTGRITIGLVPDIL